MATYNGPYQNRGRIEWYWTITGSGNSRTVYVETYLRMDQYASTAINSPYSWSGAWGSGSSSRQMNIGAGGRHIIHSRSWTENLSSNNRSISNSVSVTHFHGTTSHTLAFDLPALPPPKPSTPSSLSVTRSSDTSHRLNWTRNSTYTAVVVQRRTNGGSWAQVGRPTGNASTWTDTTTRANSLYQYRVAGVSAGGQSGWSGTASVYTTPAAVGAVAAEKVGSGIEVTATGLPPYATAYEVSDSGSLLDSNVTSFPWLHSAPEPSVTHTYSVVAKRGTLKSAGKVSNTVQLQAPPLAPTGLAPNGAVSASDLDTTFVWVHNPVDTTAQTAYELRYRPVDGAWTTLTGTTGKTRTIELPEGSYEWQVRTKGAHATFGPWSAIATVEVVTRPGVAVQGDGTTDSPIYTAVWTFTQDQGRPQSAWQVELLDAGMERLEYREGSGAQTSLTLRTRLVDGRGYTVRVRAATGGIWSEWSPVEIGAEFIPPAEPLVEGGWSELTGTVELTVTEGGGAVVADLVTIERSIDGGIEWETFVDESDLEGMSSFSDRESLSNGVTLYRVIATYSVNGAAASAEFEAVADSPAIWLSGGEEFAESARLPYNPEVQISAGRARTSKRYSGRSLPVIYSGESVERAVQFGGSILMDDTDVAGLDTLERIAQAEYPLHQYRDPDGRRIFGMLGPISTTREAFSYWSYSASLEESER